MGQVTLYRCLRRADGLGIRKESAIAGGQEGPQACTKAQRGEATKTLATETEEGLVSPCQQCQGYFRPGYRYRGPR